MCGRYSMTKREEELVERFNIEKLLLEGNEIRARYNVSPTQSVPVILEQDGQRTLAVMKWGLIPFWTKDIKKQKPIINARSESIAEKPFFKQAANKRRCLIPADGFFEWRKENKAKIPMYIHFPDRALFAFAGLWDKWTSPEGEVIHSCTIITTEANDFMTPVHDRMPVFVRPDQEQRWLDPEIKDVEQLRDILVQLPNDALEMYAVSTDVNSSKNDQPHYVEPVAVQPSLLDMLKSVQTAAQQH